MPSHDAGDHALQPRRLAAPELSVLTIDVVHQLRDDRQPRVGEPEPGHQRLEGAAIALVCVLGLEHVEAELAGGGARSEEHTSELQSPDHLVCRLLLEKKNRNAKWVYVSVERAA